jgi:hypothetical protein
MMEPSPTLFLAATAVGFAGIIMFGVCRWLMRKEREGADWPQFAMVALILPFCGGVYWSAGRAGFAPEFFLISAGLVMAAGIAMLLGRFVAHVKALLWPHQSQHPDD